MNLLATCQALDPRAQRRTRIVGQGAPGGPRRQRGAAEVVQVALIAPIALLLIVGVVELSVAFFNQAALTNAARAAVREAIRYPCTAGSAEAAAVAAVGGRNMFVWGGSGNLTAAMVQVAPANYCGVANGTQVTVTITYPYGFIFLPGFVEALNPIDELVARARMQALRLPP